MTDTNQIMEQHNLQDGIPAGDTITLIVGVTSEDKTAMYTFDGPMTPEQVSARLDAIREARS